MGDVDLVVCVCVSYVSQDVFPRAESPLEGTRSDSDEAEDGFKRWV